MQTLGTHFEELLNTIRPPADRLQAAQDLPPKVRDFLESHKEFKTVHPHSRLAGSYGQDMSVGDVKDVDFLIRVDGDPEENQPEAKRLIQDLRTALDDLPEALGWEGWAGVDIARARRSVHVYIRGRDFHLDVVPCIAPDGFDAALYVPDRGFNKWVASHPLGFIKLLSELNRDHGNKVRPLGKLLKHFRNYQMKTRQPKSYWLGVLLVHHVQDGLDTSQPLAVLFRDLLKAIYNQYASLLPRTDEATPNIPDPMLGHNISRNWSRQHFETFMRRVDEGRRWATNALEAEDRDTAIGWWQRVFGAEYFPSDVSEAIKRSAATALPGRSFVGSSGLVTATMPEARLSTPTQPTTFHGTTGQ